MSLERIRDRRVFDDARTDAERARYYVRSREMGLEVSADRELMQVLKAEDKARVQVVGPSGAGKTSLIVRVLGDLFAAADDRVREVLILRVGDRPENLIDSARVLKLVLDTLAAQAYRFSNLDEDVLAAAAADNTTVTPEQATHQFGADARVVSYQATLTESFATRGFEPNAARLRHDVEDVLRAIADSGCRPVLVLDDTEKFVGPGEDGRLDAGSVANLYDNGVRVLAELDLDLVVATHPRFDEVEKVVEVCDRIGPARIEAPRMPTVEGSMPMRAILARRLGRGGIDAGLDDIIRPEAIDALQVLYHDRRSDLRSVLRIAHGAVERALVRKEAVIEVLDVTNEIVASPR